jgi:hypothetical protein
LSQLQYWYLCFTTQPGSMTIIMALLNILVIISFLFLIWKNVSQPIKKFFWPALILKIACGISLGIIYKYYYTANDTFLFFEDAKNVTAFARENAYNYIKFLWQSDESFTVWNTLVNVEPRSLFFVKILSFINLLTGDNYWVSSMWFSLLSFIGCWYLFSRLTLWINDLTWPAAISFLFFPSFIFWSSGIIKESIATGALCFILGFFLILMQKEKPSVVEWILVFIAGHCLWSLKYYWGAILFPTLITTLIMTYIMNPYIRLKPVEQILVWSVFFLFLCLGTSYVHPNFYLERLLDVVVENYKQFASISAQKGMIHYHHLSATWLGMFLNTPWAIFSGLFRPFIFESENIFQLFSSIENLLLFILFISSLGNIRCIGASPFRLLLFGAIVYVLLLCTFLALSTPNFGTLSRYRIGFLHVFLFLILYRNPLISKIPFLKNYIQ